MLQINAASKEDYSCYIIKEQKPFLPHHFAYISTTIHKLDIFCLCYFIHVLTKVSKYFSSSPFFCYGTTSFQIEKNNIKDFSPYIHLTKKQNNGKMQLWTFSQKFAIYFAKKKIFILVHEVVPKYPMYPCLYPDCISAIIIPSFVHRYISEHQSEMASHECPAPLIYTCLYLEEHLYVYPWLTFVLIVKCFNRHLIFF